MQLSSKSLHFHEHKLKETLTLTNSNTHKVIFKIKVTNTQIFHIVPGKGFINGQQDLHVQIGIKYQNDVIAKLLIMYGPALHQSDNFDTVWSSLEKTQIKEQLIPITFTHSPRREVDPAVALNNGSKQVTFKQTQSPVYEHELQKSKSQISQSSSRQLKKQNPQVKPSIDNSQRMIQTVRQSQRTISAPSSLAPQPFIVRSHVHFSHMEKQLKSEREQTKVLRDKLAEKERKLKYYQNITQKAINDTFKAREQPFKLNHCNICLLMIVCLLLGFTIARSQFVQGFET